MKMGVLVSGALLSLAPFSLSVVMPAFRQYEVPESEKSVDELLGRIAEALAAKYHMRPCGTMAAMPGGDVKGLGLRFDICGPLTKAELRAIVIGCAKTFVVYVNEDERVRPHLNHHPFRIEDVDIIIFVQDARRAALRSPNIGRAGILNGQLRYLILDEKDNGIPVTKSREIESYAEALDAMQQEQEGAVP